MVQSNKVLTVSYGTFSCTLEGFEDSFDTMKAIAEYFRDLAADDRYFGAEPPQPDTEMLARIAEREVARHVEARREGSGFVLRAAQATAPAALAATEPPGDTAAPEDKTAAAPEPAEAPEQTAPEVSEAEVEAQAPEARPQSEAEPIAKAEAEAFMAATEDAAEEYDEDDGFAEEAIADEEIDEVDMASAEEGFDEDDMPPAEEDFDEDDMSFADEDEVEMASAEEAAAEPVAPPAAPAPDSIAAKLQRIRAVVSRNEQATIEAEYSEDEHSEDAFAAAPSDERLADEVLDEEIQEATAEDEIEDTPEDRGATAPDANAETEAEPDEYTDDPEDDPIMARRAARLHRRLARAQHVGDEEKIARVEAAIRELANPEPDTLDDEYDADDTLFADLDRAPKAGLDDTDENILVAEPEDDLDEDVEGRDATQADARPPRVVMGRHAKAHDDESPRAKAPVVPSIELPPSTLEPDAEAELMRELAEVEAELRGEAAKAQPAAPAEPAQAQAQDRTEAAATRKSREASSDLSRLMAAADEKLDAPEATSTREAYSHLRAAVAATHAERSAGGEVGQDEDTEAYRADLARVVQPRRPKPAAAQTRRPASPEQQRPAPLKLVAEQRVDHGQARASVKTGPVRPRRIAATVEAPAPIASDESFVAFAEEMGVQELPELLEAAAAYMQFVEGRDQFTRPQLIHKAREAVEGDFSREDGLRAFGTLLREGKIIKTDNGRFIASGEIGFQPASRAAG